MPMLSSLRWNSETIRSWVAGNLRDQVREETQLSVSIGIGSNKMIAKVATREAKQRRAAFDPGSYSLPPSPVVLVSSGGERDYLAPWPARVLPGVGPRVET